MMPESKSEHSSVSPVCNRKSRLSEVPAPMILARISPRRLNFDLRTFECVRCYHVTKSLVAADPMQSDLLGWLFGELRPPRNRRAAAAQLTFVRAKARPGGAAAAWLWRSAATNSVNPKAKSKSTVRGQFSRSPRA
jgi:hypothetical protein